MIYIDTLRGPAAQQEGGGGGGGEWRGGGGSKWSYVFIFDKELHGV